MQNDTVYMQQALDLAKLGWPKVLPNPLVGCVIVHKTEVVASGFHEQFGKPHAEVNAVSNLPAHLPTADCTLYVTLEPCSHHGKTPPCCDLIIKKGFKEIVIASPDPNPLVAGNGIRRLKEAGVIVRLGVLEKEARELNPRFFCFYEKKRPYIILKWARSADGFISRLPVPKNREENTISGPEAGTYVHQMRAEAQGILVGKNTVLADNPSLTTRLVNGPNPTRIFIDRDLQVPRHYAIYNEAAPTLILNAVMEGVEKNIRFIKIDFKGNVLTEICAVLHRFSIQTLLVEGGNNLLEQFISAGLWDEALVIENPALNLGQGVKQPTFQQKQDFTWLGKDKLFHFKNQDQS